MTNGSGCYSFKDAKFGLYKDKACTDKVATLTTDENGNSDTEEVDVGDYYVKGARRFPINATSVKREGPQGSN